MLHFKLDTNNLLAVEVHFVVRVREHCRGTIFAVFTADESLLCLSHELDQSVKAYTDGQRVNVELEEVLTFGGVF